jgi:two-component system, NtrC family, response regulator AtoC
MASSHVLVIDDEPALRQILAHVLKEAGYTVDVAAGVTEASAILSREDIDVAVCDIKMPDGNGVELLRDTRAAGIDTVFVMVTAISTVETAVDALRAGAFDYMVKPVRNAELLHRVAQIEAMRGLREENLVLRKAVREKSPARFRFQSPGMLHAERLAAKVAPTNSTVLITGESGTGKSVLARQIHQMSLRSEQPFITVNCGAIPETLLESEFFGHTKGAFTSADKARKGLFTATDGGTLFLDEVGELPLSMQAKLLHAIEEKQVRAVGSEQARKVDVRIIAATNRDLAAMVEQGKFREDLFFRLSAFQIVVPPLRDHPAEIRELVRFLLHNGSDSAHRQGMEIDADAESYLLAYGWPGNLRELDNVINRAGILAENNCITVADLPANLVNSVTPATASLAPPGASLREQVQSFESDVVHRAVDLAQGDLKLAAQRLGIRLSSLYRKLGEHAKVGENAQS